MTQEQFKDKIRNVMWSQTLPDTEFAILCQLYDITYYWKHGNNQVKPIPTWNPSAPIPKKIKFSAKYPQKYLRSVFLKLNLIVTNYSCEYGNSIVYFKPISNSQ